MRKRLRFSPGLLVAVIGIVAALGGTALAGPSLTGAKKHKSKHPDAAADKRLIRSELKKAAPKLSVASAVHATSADSATNATNATNATHASAADTAGSAQPVAFALIKSDGTVLDGKGITNANVTHPSTGTYCISGLSFTIRGAQVTNVFEGSYGTTNSFTSGSTGFCPAGGQVITVDNANAPANLNFNIVVYG
jgi:hypothetical protein